MPELEMRDVGNGMWELWDGERCLLRISEVSDNGLTDLFITVPTGCRINKDEFADDRWDVIIPHRHTGIE